MRIGWSGMEPWRCTRPGLERTTVWRRKGNFPRRIPGFLVVSSALSAIGVGDPVLIGCPHCNCTLPDRVGR
ncbi:hypothetical protein BJX68DRAFT_232956 [Aspergillus pseudodeflectus]|uniref:LITAF domain-containing protein n=1 Tax=Aspergillus pseudodeflectus TaxID=176178 RepID=A0ABR4KPG3_9EURO